MTRPPCERSSRAKGAIRDVGKALGWSEHVIETLSAGMWSWRKELVTERSLRELNLNPEDRRLALTLKLAQQLMGAPRHLGQHPGGFVLTHDRLGDLVPIGPATMADRQVIMMRSSGCRPAAATSSRMGPCPKWCGIRACFPIK